MARIFITGSSDGMGSLAAQKLIKDGHKVYLHARNSSRAKDAENACPGAEGVMIGDLSSMSQTKKLADDLNKSGTFDAVIHNAGLFHGGFRKTEDGLPSLMAVNTFAPYVLTCLLEPTPKRLVFLSSQLHSGGDPSLKDLSWTQRGEKGWSDSQGYGDSKLHNIMLAKYFARKFGDKGVVSSALDPGWMPTKMGGKSAPGDTSSSVQSYVKLAVGDGVTNGRYWRPGGKESSPMSQADDVKKQDQLISVCEQVTGVKVP